MAARPGKTANTTVSGRTPKTSGTIMPISFFPADSIRSRFAVSRTSWAWARSTSASGVPRSTATISPSTNRTNGPSSVRDENSCRASTSGFPARVSARTRVKSLDSSPRALRHTRSRAPVALSPALTARAISSATLGNSAIIRASRFLTWAPSSVVAATG